MIVLVDEEGKKERRGRWGIERKEEKKVEIVKRNETTGCEQPTYDDKNTTRRIEEKRHAMMIDDVRSSQGGFVIRDPK